MKCLFISRTYIHRKYHWCQSNFLEKFMQTLSIQVKDLDQQNSVEVRVTFNHKSKK